MLVTSPARRWTRGADNRLSSGDGDLDLGHGRRQIFLIRRPRARRPRAMIDASKALSISHLDHPPSRKRADPSHQGRMRRAATTLGARIGNLVPPEHHNLPTSSKILFIIQVIIIWGFVLASFVWIVWGIWVHVLASRSSATQQNAKYENVAYQNVTYQNITHQDDPRYYVTHFAVDDWKRPVVYYSLNNTPWLECDGKEFDVPCMDGSDYCDNPRCDDRFEMILNQSLASFIDSASTSIRELLFQQDPDGAKVQHSPLEHVLFSVAGSPPGDIIADALKLEPNLCRIRLFSKDRYWKGFDRPGSLSPRQIALLRERVESAIIHEIVHCVQGDPWHAPRGLIEGVADWVTLRLGHSFDLLKGGPDREFGGDRWDSGYGVTAIFLDWIEREYGPGAVTRMDQKLWAEKDYLEAVFWEELFGATVQQLWESYREDAWHLDYLGRSIWLCNYYRYRPGDLIDPCRLDYPAVAVAADS